MLGKNQGRRYICNLFHVVDHLIVALGLLAEPRKEGFTRRLSGIVGGGGLMVEIPFALQLMGLLASCLIIWMDLGAENGLGV